MLCCVWKESWFYTYSILTIVPFQWAMGGTHSTRTSSCPLLLLISETGAHKCSKNTEHRAACAQVTTYLASCLINLTCPAGIIPDIYIYSLRTCTQVDCRAHFSGKTSSICCNDHDFHIQRNKAQTNFRFCSLVRGIVAASKPLRSCSKLVVVKVWFCCQACSLQYPEMIFALARSLISFVKSRP
jgi:hypothetical protein